MATNSFQVVWAKVRGYPWWPGIIKNNPQEYQNLQSQVLMSNDSLTTLNFIGENTHANLNSKFIKDFNKNLEKYSKTSDKHLINCIKVAQQLLDGEISIESIPEINKELRQKKYRKNNSATKDIEVKLFELQGLISNKKRCFESNKTACQDAYKKHEKILAEIAERRSIENTGAALCETLIEIVKLNFSSILNDAHIRDLLQTIADVCLNSNFILVKEIGKVVKMLGKFSDKESLLVIDKCLRSKVCTKIVKVLESNQFEKSDARTLALSIEEKIRKMDPSMGVKYRQCFRKMIKEIKVIKYSDYNEFAMKSM